MLVELSGNLLDSPCNIIIHQANNRRVMGAGLAQQIRTKFPTHYKQYLASPMKLGTSVVTRINDNLFVIALIAQDGFGRDGRCYTNYNALEQCLAQLSERFQRSKFIPIIGIPHGMGAGLGGGNWNTIHQLIEHYFSAYDCRIYTYKRG